MISKILDWLLTLLLPIRSNDNLNWELEADWAHHDQQPLRARALLYWGGVIVVL